MSKQQKIKGNLMFNPSIKLTGTVAVSALLLSASGHAQTIDYGSLEMLFGQPVTTSATGRPQLASEVPATMTIITAEDIRRSGKMNVGMILRDYAGMDLSQPSALRVDVGIRGGNQPYNPLLLVLVNGRQVYNDHFGLVNWDGLGIELSDIRQIEVVKGPQSALFGFNAVEGVVNIVTFNPMYDHQGTLTAEYGEDGFLQVSATKSMKLSQKMGLRLSAGYKEADDFKAALPILNGIAPKRQSVSAEAVFQTSPRSHLTVSGHWNKNYNLSQVPIFADFGASFETTHIRGEFITDTDRFGQIKTTLFQNTMRQRLDPYNMGVLGEFDMENKVSVFKIEDLFSVGSSNNMRVAAEYRHNEYWGNSEGVDNLAGTIKFDLMSASAMWEHIFSDSVTGTLAARLDHVKFGQDGVVDPRLPFSASDFDRNVTEYSYNASLRIKTGDVSSMRLIASRGVQLPSLINLGSSFIFRFMSPQILFSGDPSLRPLTNTNYELGWDTTVSDTKVGIAAFYSRYNDVSVFPPGPNLFPPQSSMITAKASNVGSFKSYGLETNLEGQLSDSLSWGANYTFTKVSLDIPGSEGSFTFLPIAFEENTPKHKANLHLAYTKGRVEADTFLRYRSAVGAYVPLMTGGFNLLPLDSSLSVDARVGFKLNDDLDLHVTTENLFGSKTLGATYVATERRIRAGITLEF